MTTCPVCSKPMTVRDRHGNRRVTCSKSCNAKRSNARMHARQADVDDAAVWRLTHGDRVASTHAERVTATAQLTAKGYGLAQVAALLRVTVRSISRYRHETATTNRKKVA